MSLMAIVSEWYVISGIGLPGVCCVGAVALLDILLVTEVVIFGRVLSNSDVVFEREVLNRGSCGGKSRQISPVGFWKRIAYRSSICRPV